MNAKQGNQNQIETKENTMNTVSKMMGSIMTIMVAGLGMLGVLMIGQDAQGAVMTITSGNFSLGYGFTANGPGWDTSETAGVNTPTTIGDFTFLPTLTGTLYSGGGPTFPNRVLSDGYGGAASGYNSTFNILGSWTGPTPPDAAPIPNYQITLTITDLKIWGHSWNGASDSGIAWSETTAGHTADSSFIYLSTGTDPNVAAYYNQLVWAPANYAVAGTSFTRSFTTLETNYVTNVSYDGFEVFGNVSLTYDVAVPEPASVSLLIIGSLCLIARRHARKASR